MESAVWSSQAIELAEVTTEDPHAGLPDVDELGMD